VSRSWRYNAPVSPLMIDIDDFKRFNDAYGHVIGDDVLRAVGRLMMMGLRRDIDVAARYGGEEFAIILPNTPIRAAHAVGERMRVTLATSKTVLPSAATAGGRSSVGAQSSAGARPQACLDEASDAPAHAGGAAKVGERLRRDIERATVLTDDGETLDSVTVSVGVAAFPDHAGDAGGLVKAADDALYTAKRAGKNRVCLADLSDSE